MHALIIEDEALIALLLEDAVRALNYRSIDHASSVAEALKAAERHQPDLIVSDHRINDGTGIEAVLTICSDQPIPVIFVTSCSADVRERVLDPIIVDKPFLASQIHAAIGQAVKTPFMRVRRDHAK